MIDHTKDGVDHINVYAMGRTQFGKFFSNMTDAPIKLSYLGDFRTIEGLWHYLKQPDDRFRTLSGFDVKKLAKEAIDEAAEAARLRYITYGSGQAMAYQEKGDEAADFIAAGYPVGSPSGSPIGSVIGSPVSLPGYPFIEAEVKATGKTPRQAADDIVAQKAAWVAVGATIEQSRLGGKKKVDEALDAADVNNERDDAIAELNAI